MQKLLGQGVYRHPPNTPALKRGLHFMARPKKQPSEKRTAQIPPIRVTDAELIRLKEKAEIASVSLSDFVRQIVLTGRVKVPRGKISAELLAELNSIGVNLNQIAYKLNAGGKIPSNFDDVQYQLFRVLEQVARSYDA